MLLGILSDTHDEITRTRRAVDVLLEQGAEALIHCGDLTSPMIVEALSKLPAWFVYGNCDNTFALARAAAEYKVHCLEDGGEIELGGRRVAVTHGHLESELSRLRLAKPDFLFSGHFHILNDWQEGTVRRINPGALHRAAKYTVGLLNLVSSEYTSIEVT